MSTLKVDGIRSNSASSDAITLASDGTCTANITNNLSNRNLIINGAMQVAQRGTSSTSSGYQTVDRFKLILTGVDENPTQAQADVAAGTTPYTSGFRKSYKLTNGNQTSGADAGDYLIIRTILEAQDIANSGWNYTSSSSYITVSFWVKSSVAQNFYGSVHAKDGTEYIYPFETGSLTADTWTKVTKTISGNSNLTFNNDNGEGLRVNIFPFFGTAFTASSVNLNQWAAYNITTQTPDSTSTWYTTNDATLEITGLQLEVGSHSTDYEFRSYGQELALCQRYYYITDPTTDAFAGGGGLFMYDSGETAVGYGSLTFAQTMRAAPTVVLRDNAGNTDGKATQHGSAHNIAATANYINENGFCRVQKSSGNFTTGAGCPIICGCTADAEL